MSPERSVTYVSSRTDGQHLHFPLARMFERQPFAAQPDLNKDLRGSPLPLASTEDDEFCRSRPARSHNLSGNPLPANSVQELHTVEKSSSSSSAVTDGYQSKTDDDEEECCSLVKTEDLKPQVAHSPVDLQRFAEALQGWTQRNTGARTQIGERAHKYVDGLIWRELPRHERVLACLAKTPGWTVDQVVTALEINFQESPGRPNSYNWFLRTVADIYQRRKAIPPQAPNQANHAAPTPSQLHPEPTKRERFQEHISRCLGADRWRLHTAYRRASDSEREQILNLLDWGKGSEAIGLAVRIIESRDEPRPRQRPKPIPAEQSIEPSGGGS